MHGWRRRRSDGWNAHLRRVEGETVVITHPCHPLAGRTVAVLHYRPRGESPSVVIERPDGSAHCVPLDWTDRARPNPHGVAVPPEARLSGLVLLEVARLVEAWRRES